jgi:Flp pilus assembly protein TadG
MRVGKGLTVAFRFRKELRVRHRHMRARAIRGAIGIEFALIAPVFLLLLMAIIETGIMLFAQSALAYATQNAARMVRTGSAQGTTYTTAARCSVPPGTAHAGGTGPGGTYANGQEWFKDQICCDIAGYTVTDCSALHVNVQSYSAGFGTGFTPPTSGTQVAVTDNYMPGNPCDVVLVRATYNWAVMTPLLAPVMSNMADGKSHLLSATGAFRNEPFTSGTSGC